MTKEIKDKIEAKADEIENKWLHSNKISAKDALLAMAEHIFNNLSEYVEQPISEMLPKDTERMPLQCPFYKDNNYGLEDFD